MSKWWRLSWRGQVVIIPASLARQINALWSEPWMTCRSRTNQETSQWASLVVLVCNKCQDHHLLFTSRYLWRFIDQLFIRLWISPIFMGQKNGHSVCWLDIYSPNKTLKLCIKSEPSSFHLFTRSPHHHHLITNQQVHVTTIGPGGVLVA